ncbi:hypothetical protein RQN9TF_31645 (plasmid) [Rhodococcus qingshengii]|uniref:hypothetical protein n=1 Tax=Rhodococcus TaxID=1827 RepID=UPI0013DDF386|nr:hypothetical protein [Rhodococcus qingshengii]BDQ23810.1 hypothetical protein RQN9TF_31645 [Rhodococcus qingshengii]
MTMELKPIVRDGKVPGSTRASRIVVPGQGIDVFGGQIHHIAEIAEPGIRHR